MQPATQITTRQSTALRPGAMRPSIARARTTAAVPPPILDDDAAAEHQHLQRRLAIIREEFVRLSARSGSSPLAAHLSDIEDSIGEAVLRLSQATASADALALAAAALRQAAARLALVEYALSLEGNTRGTLRPAD